MCGSWFCARGARLCCSEDLGPSGVSPILPVTEAVCEENFHRVRVLPAVGSGMSQKVSRQGIQEGQENERNVICDERICYIQTTCSDSTC